MPLLCDVMAVDHAAWPEPAIVRKMALENASDRCLSIADHLLEATCRLSPLQTDPQHYSDVSVTSAGSGPKVRCLEVPCHARNPIQVQE